MKLGKKIWPDRKHAKNLNPTIREMERNEPKPKPLLTEKVRARLNEPYSASAKIKKAIKDAKES